MNITNYKLKRFTKSNGKNSLSIIMAYQTITCWNIPTNLLKQNKNMTEREFTKEFTIA